MRAILICLIAFITQNLSADNPVNARKLSLLLQAGKKSEWTFVKSVKLGFSVYHPQGMVKIKKKSS